MNNAECTKEVHKKDNMIYGSDCCICASPLLYTEESTLMECSICNRQKYSNTKCKNNHFVCDECHSGFDRTVESFFLNTRLKKPLLIIEKAMEFKDIHLHGPEHHYLVAASLLAAYHNCGGKLDLPKKLQEAKIRGSQVPGGTCGFWGVCGATAGAGIFASIVLDSTPLNEEVWHLPQQLVAQCLNKIASYGGPRCCKRTSRLSIECAMEFSKEKLGTPMDTYEQQCNYFEKNKECIFDRCPYFK